MSVLEFGRASALEWGKESVLECGKVSVLECGKTEDGKLRAPRGGRAMADAQAEHH